jgi:hypothetical protein
MARIEDEVLNGDYVDGTNWDALLFNKAVNVLKAGINANYDDIVEIQDKLEAGTTETVVIDGKTITIIDGLITSIV